MEETRHESRSPVEQNDPLTAPEDRRPPSHVRNPRLSRRARTVVIAAVTAVVVVAAGILLFNHLSPGRPAALIQAGDSKTRCLNVAPGASLRQAEQDIGMTFNCLETFTNQDLVWSNWESPWVTENGYGYNTWLAADPANRQIIMTLTLVPKNVAKDPTWAAQCAAGGYNSYARQLASNLVHTGFGYSVIRLGAEMNGTWNAGSLGTTVTQWHQWGQCFAQEVQAMRGVPGGHFLFDWNINANYRNIPLADFYPGNSYVDMIGIDAYDAAGTPGASLPPVGSPARWAALTSEPDGLNAVAKFAAEHGKPLSIPEWGTVSWQGDDASYVTNMGAFIANHNVAFQSWFDDGNDEVFVLNRNQAPRSLAAYIKAFGSTR